MPNMMMKEADTVVSMLTNSVTALARLNKHNTYSVSRFIILGIEEPLYSAKLTMKTMP